MSVAKVQRQALEKADLQGSNFEPKRQTEWHALHRRESLMRRWGQFDVDGVAGEDQAARNNNSHHTSFADEFAVGISSEDCGHLTVLKLIELRTGVAQARDPHDGGFTNMQFCPGWKLQEIHPSRRDVFTELPWRDGETLCSQFFKEFGVEQVDLAQVGL